MATLTRAEAIGRVLELIGVKAAGQSASAEDESLAGEVFDAAYERLNREGLAPFSTTAIPEWAQYQLECIAAFECGPFFGLGGERLGMLAAKADAGRVELARQALKLKAAKAATPVYF